MRSLSKSMGNKRDELYTPKILVKPIIPFIPNGKIVWCPFDTEKSEFVIELRKAGVSVVYSHLIDGQDFFSYEPKEWDIIITNPPFTSKLMVFDRLYSFNKPFAVLMNIEVLNYQEVGYFFYEKQRENKKLQLHIVDKKVSFDGNTSSFNTSYFGYNFFPQDIGFCHLSHNNSNKFFTASKMWEDEVRIMGG